MAMKGSTLNKVWVDEAQSISKDPEKLTHIVNPTLNKHIRLWHLMTAQSIVNYARQVGIHVVALCGKKWVPNDDPEKYDACGTCMEIAGNLIREDEG